MRRSRSSWTPSSIQEARPATIHGYRSFVDLFPRDTGITSLEELMLQAIRRWLAGREHLAPNTLATDDRCLRVPSIWLERRGYVPESPKRPLPKPHTKRTIVQTLSREALRRPGPARERAATPVGTSP